MQRHCLGAIPTREQEPITLYCMPNITLHISTEIVTAKNLSELVDSIRQIQNRDKADRIITLTCAVTVVQEESLESLPECSVYRV